MILSDITIKKMLKSKELVVEPLCQNSLQPASIDCRLGSHYLLVDDTQVEGGVLSFDQEIKYRELTSDSIVIPPHTFLLATTMEYIKLPLSCCRSMHCSNSKN